MDLTRNEPDRSPLKPSEVHKACYREINILIFNPIDTIL